MPLLNRILQLVNFAKKNDMTQPSEFEPTDIIQHRYLDPQVLVNYIKTLPDKFKDEQITIKVLEDGRLGLRLPRKLTQEELDGALQAFVQAERARQDDDGD